MRGGIERTAFQIDLARKHGQRTVYLDTGNALFGQLQSDGEAVAQQERKASAIAQSMAIMGLEAFFPGPLDDVRGAPFRRTLGLPEVSQETVKRFDLGSGHTLAVFSSPSLDRLWDLAAAAKGSHASFTLGLFEGPLEAALAAGSRSKGPDLMIATRAKDAFAAEETRIASAETPLVQLQSKGRSLLRIDLTLRGETPVMWLKEATETERELAALAARVELLVAQINDPSSAEETRALRRAKLAEVVARREALASRPLEIPPETSSARLRAIAVEANLESLPAARQIVTAYDRDVGALNIAWAEKNPQRCAAVEPGQPSFVGSEQCAGCHRPAMDAWRISKHAQAFTTLKTQGKNAHLDCIGCHVTGWKAPGGPCQVNRVSGREEVGCESCHGPGSLHVTAPSSRNVLKGSAQAQCVSCHDHENSPHFNFETYLAQIVTWGHGASAPASKPAASRTQEAARAVQTSENRPSFEPGSRLP
jgi:hypothetical protein